jgi:hypothetical protein
MRITVTIIGSLLLLAIAAFCAFGFLATFEPSDTPGMFMVFRIGYSVVGVACLVGTIALIVKGVRKSRST